MPLVPAAALITLATYFFIKAESVGNHNRKAVYSFVAGTLIGLAYITHPEGIILLFYIGLYGIASLVILDAKKKKFRELSDMLVFVVLGFLGGYSLMGFYYLFTVNNFLLYPIVDHTVFLFQAGTQPVYNVSVLNGLTLTYTTGEPGRYLNLITKTQLTKSLYVEYGLFYFSILGFLAIVFAVILLFLKIKKSRFFIGMFAFYMIALSFMPTNIKTLKNGIDLLIVNSVAMYGVVLVLPVIIIVSLGIDYLISRKNAVFKYIAAGLIIAVIIFSLMDLNYDTTVYRNSLSTVYTVLNFINQHPNNIYYGNRLFVGEIVQISNFKYLNTVLPLFNCSKPSVSKLNNTYIITGGTINIDMSPPIMHDFNNCLTKNLSSAAVQIVNTSNPFDASSPIVIYKT
jgi:hypothetical protein